MNYRVSLLVLMLALGLLYSYRIADKPLDYDERYSLNIATGIGGHTNHFLDYGTFIAEPLDRPFFSSKDYQKRYKLANVVSTDMNDNGQGLPYFIIQHAWLLMVGVSTTNARLLSLIFMLLAVPLFYFLLRKWGISERNSLLFTLLFFCNGIIIGLATYVRFYALGIFLSTLSSYYITHLYGKKISLRQSLLLGILWALFFFTQYFSIFLIAAQFLVLVFQKDWRSRFQQIVPALAVSVSVLLLWLFALNGWESWRNIYYLKSNIAYGGASLPPLRIEAVLLSWCSALSNAVGQPIQFSQSFGVSSAAVLLLALPAWLCILSSLLNRKIEKPFWLKYAILGIGIFSAAALTHTFLSKEILLFFARYWVFVFVLSYGLLAWTWAQYPRFSKPFKMLSILFMVFLIVRSGYTVASYASNLGLAKNGSVQTLNIPLLPDYENLAQDVVELYQNGDTVVYNSWKNAQMSNWFLLENPELWQQVDTNLSAVAMLQNGGRKVPLQLHLGYRKAARAAWFQ